MNTYTLPVGWALNIYQSTFFGCLCGDLASPGDKGLLFPIPDSGLTQADIDSAVNEIVCPESAPSV